MWKDFLYYTKTERQGIIVLVVLILGVYAAPELFAFFTRTEDTGCTKNEKSDQEYNDLLPLSGKQNLTTGSVILFHQPLKGKLSLRCSIRTPQTPLLSFRSDYRRG